MNRRTLLKEWLNYYINKDIESRRIEQEIAEIKRKYYAENNVNGKAESNSDHGDTDERE